MPGLQPLENKWDILSMKFYEVMRKAPLSLYGGGGGGTSLNECQLLREKCGVDLCFFLFWFACRYVLIMQLELEGEWGGGGPMKAEAEWQHDHSSLRKAHALNSTQLFPYYYLLSRQASYICNYFSFFSSLHSVLFHCIFGNNHVSHHH